MVPANNANPCLSSELAAKGKAFLRKAIPDLPARVLTAVPYLGFPGISLWAIHMLELNPK
jgi:hypothetical protein